MGSYFFEVVKGDLFEGGELFQVIRSLKAEFSFIYLLIQSINNDNI